MRGSEPEVRKDSRLFGELCAAILRRGRSVRFRVHGESMNPNVLDGDVVTVAPVASRDLHRGDIALSQSPEGFLVHRVVSSLAQDGPLQTKSDTALAADPCADRVFGRVTHIERGGKQERLNAWQVRCVHPLRSLSRRARMAAQIRMRRFLPGSCSIFAAGRNV